MGHEHTWEMKYPEREVMGKLTDEQIDKAAATGREIIHYNRVSWDRCSEDCKEPWRRLAREIAPHLQYQPEPVSGDLLRRCIDTWYAIPGDYKGMSAVIRVVLDEALKPILFHRSGGVAVEAINEHLENVRANLLRPKSPEERVKRFCTDTCGGYWCVVVDEDREHLHTAYHLSEHVSELYAERVIAKLKEEESKP